jgi:D-sedoheptulose 7-phosphate isomerase
MVDLVSYFSQYQALLNKCFDDKNLQATVEEVYKELLKCFQNRGTLFLLGNGGSAAEAQHMAAEYINKMHIERLPMAAIALSTDTSNLTSIGNDRGFEYVFSRQIEALAKAGDVLFGFSTSGQSKNVLRSFQVAREKGLATVLFTGSQSSVGDSNADLVIHVPSTVTPEIQTIHTILGHYLAAKVEKALFD